MTRIVFATASLAVLLSSAALAQDAPVATTPEATSKVVVPGNNSGIDSTMPADAASTVTTTMDAPTVTNGQSTSSVVVPGNNSGIDSTMPAGAASTVTTNTDAATVPADAASPVPGTQSGESATPPAN